MALRIEHRKMYRSNGLIDDFVVYGAPEEYLLFAYLVDKAIAATQPIMMLTESNITVEINCADFIKDQLFTTLENEQGEYLTHADWEARDRLRIYGNPTILRALQQFLIDLSGRGKGYSYLCEYSTTHPYAADSPEWRLHVVP
ncbi:hypothetical protein [Marinicella meishanensis]|uniref:hypothetical protein n=1 Tax=Marinicella meishanensis TaxID=2873263 RepID=UPI001CBB1D0D|nr:hypothetical protein [Marinicella sp. NBU2979]